MRLYIGLVHYPVYNKNFQTIASAITTLDVHDIARLARTFDVKLFFVITPLEDQQCLARRIYRHWTVGFGAEYNRHRKEAIELVRVVPSLDKAMLAIGDKEGKAPLVIATAASRQERNRSISCEEARCMIEDDLPVLLIFGTAWGLERALIDTADYVLEPIRGRGSYNHLSVRAAVAIILDRLAGR